MKLVTPLILLIQDTSTQIFEQVSRLQEDLAHQLNDAYLNKIVNYEHTQLDQAVKDQGDGLFLFEVKGFLYLNVYTM